MHAGLDPSASAVWVSLIMYAPQEGQVSLPGLVEWESKVRKLKHDSKTRDFTASNMVVAGLTAPECGLLIK